jgi:aldose 1-epimerase
MAPSHPSITLRHGRAFARLAPSLGGRIAACELRQADGRITPALHPFPEGETQVEQWAKGGIYPLVPYWGRIDHAALRHEGTTYPLQMYPDAAPHTLHGIAQRRPWHADQTAPNTAVMTYSHAPDTHWPWPFVASIAIILMETQLRADLVLTNTGEATMPAGIGFHPYLPRDPLLQLRLKAQRCWESTPDYLAVRPKVIPSEIDFRIEKPLADNAFTAFYENWQSPLSVRQGTGARLLLGASDTLNHLVLHQPEGTPYICIEPVSHVADAFNLAERGVDRTGAVLLASGASLAGQMTLRWETPSNGT